MRKAPSRARAGDQMRGEAGERDRPLGRAATRRRSARRRVLRVYAPLLAAAMLLAAAPTSAQASGSSAVGWGRNLQFQLGAGYRTQHGVGGEPRPVGMVGLTDITQLTAGSAFTVTLLGDGTVRAFGANTFGQLGDGTRESTREEGVEGEEGEEATLEETRSTVSGLKEVAAVAAADTHAMALLDNGTVVTWGTNQDGEHGDGEGGVEKETKENNSVPLAVEGLEHVVEIAAGGASDYALVEVEGHRTKLVAWGKDNKDQLGIGEYKGTSGPESCKTEVGLQACSTIPREVGLKLKSGEYVQAISAGSEAAYALLNTGRILSWGDNGKGALGTGGKLQNFGEPQEVAGVTEAVAVSGGGRDALALLKDGEVVGWGINNVSQLGTSTEEAEKEVCQKEACHKTPQPIEGLSHVSAISAGTSFSLALREGRIYAFGENEDGKLGLGITKEHCEKTKVVKEGKEEEVEVCRPEHVATPTAIEGIAPVAAIIAANTHAVALLESGHSAPAPLLSVKAGVESMELKWLFPVSESEPEEVKIKYHPAAKEKEKETSKSFKFTGPGSHLFDEELRPEPYVFTVINGGPNQTLRAVTATPEP
jgi:alpha-tubulin suppressor-like RCC1 family protein